MGNLLFFFVKIGVYKPKDEPLLVMQDLIINYSSSGA